MEVLPLLAPTTPPGPSTTTLLMASLPLLSTEAPRDLGAVLATRESQLHPFSMQTLTDNQF